MNYKSYRAIADLYEYMSIYSSEVANEALLNYFNCSSMEEVYEIMPKEEIEFVKNWLSARNDDDNRKFFIEKIREDFANMSQEDLSKALGFYINDSHIQTDLFRALSNKSDLIDMLIDYNYGSNLGEVLRGVPQEELISLVNNNDPISDIIMQNWVVSTHNNTNDQYPIIRQIESDFNRAKFLLYGADIKYLPEIEDLYYRNQIMKSNSREFRKVRLNVFLGEIDVYHEHLEKISQMKDEKEKAEYIANSVTDNEMKEVFLFSIEGRENRDHIISSFSRLVDTGIEDVDNLARTMISEFFEDNLGENYSEDKKERVDIVFNKTTVYYDKLNKDTNGTANYVNKSIRISDRHKGNINKLIYYMIHEYSHMFSNFYFSYTGEKCDDIAEEGMADAFSDLVINHYLNKHKEVFMNGKRVRIDKPYVSKSAYEYENSIARTMLAGLEKDGKDIEAACEYVIGDKNRFAEMVFGEKQANYKKKTKFDEIIIKTNESELYHSPTLDFTDINENSIYYRRNCILPLFQIQNRLDDSIDIVYATNHGQYYKASFVANEYFNDKKFYEVPKEELSNFMRLLEAQKTPNSSSSPIQEIGYYKNTIIDTLEDEEIKENSFEILERITSIYGKQINAGENLERVMKIAFDEEIRKINDGQPIELTKEKAEILKQEFTDAFNGSHASNDYINDFINDFYFEVSLIEEKNLKEDSDKKITPQQIGEATIDASIKIKNEVSGMENNEKAREKEHENPDKTD